MTNRYLGQLEELVLLAVGALGDDAYGVSVQRALERDAGRRVTLGAVYAALDRLEGKRLLRSRLGDAEGRPGGRRKRLFHLTGEGRAMLRRAERAREALLRLAEHGGG